MRRLATAAVAAALGVAAFPATPRSDACAAADRKINFFVLLDNSTSGTYDTCLRDLRDKVARARLRARIHQGQAARLEAEAGKLEGEHAAAARRLAAANARQANALERLEGAKESRSVDRARLKDVLSRGEEIARELEELNHTNGANEAQAERLERELDELNRRIDAMLGEG